jgi:glutathione S-transferase
MLRALEEPRVLLEVAPGIAAKLMSEGSARWFVRMFNDKYAIDAGQVPQYQRVVREELQRVQRALADGRRYLTGELSYADIVVGIALMLLGPLPGETPVGLHKLGYDPELSAEFQSLRAWRDAVHAVEPLVGPTLPQPSAATQGAPA